MAEEMHLNSTAVPDFEEDTIDNNYWTERCLQMSSFLNTHYIDFDNETYILLVVVVIGAIGNVVNIVVYSHKEMRSPINVIFKSLALTDLFLLIIYFVELYYDILAQNTSQRESGRALNVNFLIIFFLIFRLAALWLTTALTYWRYVALSQPLHTKSRCNLASCRMSVTAIYVISFFVNLPFLFLKRVNRTPLPTSLAHNMRGTTNVNTTSWLYEHGEMYFWLYRSLLILISMILLMIMSAGLFSYVRRTRSWRRGLTMSTNGKKDEQMNRINKMILSVVVLYLMTEFLCIMACLHRVGFVFLKSDFYNCIYEIRVLQLSVYVNPCINTLCYFLMSRQYRKVVFSMFGSNDTLSSTASLKPRGQISNSE